MAKVMLASGLIVAYGYLTETFTAWYSGHEAEWFVDREPRDRAVRASLLAADRVQHRRSAGAVVRAACGGTCTCCSCLSLVINVGMWLERFIIVVVSLHRDYLPSSWGMYVPTFWDWSTYIGTIGLFTALMFLFIRLLPVISIFEMREMVEEAHEESHEHRRANNFGLLAEFVEPDELVAATAQRPRRPAIATSKRTRRCRWKDLPEAVGFPRSRMPLVVLIGGIVGCLTGFAIAVLLTVIAYPLNIGGRPLNSWPSFVPVMFELTVLFAALSAVLGMLAMNGLPRPHHPLFAMPQIRSGDAGPVLSCAFSRGSDVSRTLDAASFSSGSAPRR